MSSGASAEAEQNLVNSLRGLSEGVIAADFAGRINFINPAAERLTGWPQDEALGRPLTDVFRISHPTGQAASFFRLAGEKNGAALLLTTRGGELLPIEDNTSPIRDADGSLVGLVVLFRPREEAVAGESGAVREDILESIAEPLFCLSGQWRFTYANAPAARNFGTERQALIGEVLWSKFPPSVYRQHYQDFCGALLRKESHSFELRDELADRWWEVSLHPFHDGLLVWMRDLTEKKAADEQNARLDRLESLGLLARGFAHDFNNLLTVLLGNLSLAEMHVGEESPARAELAAARAASLQAQGLVQNLLTFAKGGAPVRRRVLFEPLVAEFFENVSKQEGVSYRLAVGPRETEVEVDPGQLRRLLSNLLRNAVQALPTEGRREVLLRVFGRQQGAEDAQINPTAVIEVIDSGRGISAEDQRQIFEPYFTTRQEENATGLGLTVCESIAKAHGGHIQVQSQPGLTIFQVTLPALAAAPDPPAPRREPSRQGGARRVLVLEDEPLIRQLLVANLGSRGFEVETTSDGRETVRRYREEFQKGAAFDLLILDLSIPQGQGGRETIEQIRAIDPQVRAIVSSGYSDDALMARYLDFGFRAVLPKPYEPAELLKCVRDVLED